MTKSKNVHIVTIDNHSIKYFEKTKKCQLSSKTRTNDKSVSKRDNTHVTEIKKRENNSSVKIKKKVSPKKMDPSKIIEHLNESINFKKNKIKLIKEIAKGGFSRVFLCQRENINNKYFAAKFLYNDKHSFEKYSKNIQNEFFLQKRCCGKYITNMNGLLEVPMEGFYEDENAKINKIENDQPQKNQQKVEENEKKIEENESQKNQQKVDENQQKVEENEQKVEENHQKVEEKPHNSNIEYTLISELELNGTISILFSKIKYFSESLVTYFAGQIFLGIEYMHKLKVCHLDIKPDNIFLSGMNNAKIADFSIGINYENQEEVKLTGSGTHSFIAPESYQRLKLNTEYLPEVDLWSLGTMAYELYFHKKPFDITKNDSSSDIQNKIFNNTLKFTGRYIHPELKDFISRLLEKDYKKRITLTQIRQHKIFKAFETLIEVKERYNDTSKFINNLAHDMF